MKAKILELLRNRTEHMSGQEICNHFGVSRTAVWKVMKRLKEEGYELEAVPNKGYRLLSCPDILTESELKSRMTTKWAGRTLFYNHVTGSTNIDVKQYMDQGQPHGTLVVADIQNAGRGRRGRSWTSREGCGIAMSIGLKPDFSPDKASMLTLIMAMGVTAAIEEVTGLEVRIKWPNDLVIDKKKVCGILTEMNLEMDYIQSVVIGAGINVNMGEIPEEIKEVATSLMLEKGEPILRADLIEKTMKYFEHYYEIFLRKLNLEDLKEEYEVHLVNKDKMVQVLDPNGEFEGKAKGITKMGDLIVEKENGTVVEVYAGEVSVRGFYGYV